VQVEVPAVARERLVVELGLPVVAEEAAVDEPEHGGAAVTGLEEVLEGVEGAVGAFGGAHGQAHGRVTVHGEAFVGGVRVRGPCRLPLGGGDRLPHLLLRGLQHDLLADLEAVRHHRLPQSLVPPG